MGRFVGAFKQLVAEVIGDANLADEGIQESNRAGGTKSVHGEQKLESQDRASRRKVMNGVIDGQANRPDHRSLPLRDGADHRFK
jgi:hypothetical protein